MNFNSLKWMNYVHAVLSDLKYRNMSSLNVHNLLWVQEESEFWRHESSVFNEWVTRVDGVWADAEEYRIRRRKCLGRDGVTQLAVRRRR